jgi:crotonobetainyl-CoA:carnitine CoA-transferase CaiB-like acyl-CoA transferase
VTDAGEGGQGEESPGPLDGITVVELGGFVAAPYAARCLGDLGARVIKVEPPEGDPSRRHGPFPGDIPHPERSGLFCLLNSNKLGVTLSLSEPEGRLRLRRLLEDADALVESLHPDEARTLGLSPDETRDRYPRLVHCSVTAFGRSGPWRHFRGHALQAGAAGGASVVIGEPGRPPLPLPCSQPDFQAGINAAAGVLLALLARGALGRGQHVDVAAADVMAFYGGITSPLYTATGLPWRRAGHRASGSGGFYPYTILPTQDGYLCMITRSGHPWKRFLDALGSPAWSTEPRYRDRAALGREYPHEGDRLLAPLLEERTSAELQELCRRQGIPFAMVRSTAEVMACPQLRARDFFVTVERAETGALPYPGAPWRFSLTPWRLRRPAPLLGQHNSEVLGASEPSRPRGEGRVRGDRATPPAPTVPLTPTLSPAGTGSRRRPLEGIRVVDFGWVAVGPVLSSLLAEFGAEVIKVESSRRLDYCRLIPTPIREDERVSEALDARAAEVDRVPLFHQYNRGKLGVTVDLRHPGAPALLSRLAAASDVIVENFSPPVLRSVGLDYGALSRVRPDLVMISCSAAGHGGPWEEVRTFAPSLTSLAGLERLIGYPRERTIGALTLGYGDPSNALHGFFAVLAALWHRQATGRGQWIDMSQLEATTGLIGEALMDFVMNGSVWETQGARHLSMAPHGIYPSAGEDRWVSIACAENREWEGLRQAMEDPPWARDARLSGHAGRAAAVVELDARLADWTRAMTAEEATARCQAHGVAAAPVLGLEAHETHPHFRARNVVVPVTHPEAGDFTLYRSPIGLSATPGHIDRAAPCLGEHNDHVFLDVLGLSTGEYEAFKSDGVIR